MVSRPILYIHSLISSRIPPEAIDKPLEYPPSRDIWSTGVVLMQMLLGFDVVNKYDDFQSALAASTYSGCGKIIC